MKMEESGKCAWCTKSALLERYHDEEWGVDCLDDDRRLFEYLLMEWMSCGLSWELMLRKREAFRACFCGYDFRRVARLGEADVEAALQYPGMIRSRRKIEATIHNARLFCSVVDEFGSFGAYLRRFSGGRHIVYQASFDGALLTRSALSDRLAADMRRRGFRFLGTVLIYSYIQSIGIVNDHSPACPRFAAVGGETASVVADADHDADLLPQEP